MSQWFAQALGVAGLHFAKLERQEHEQRQQEQDAYYQALRDVA